MAKIRPRPGYKDQSGNKGRFRNRVSFTAADFAAIEKLKLHYRQGNKWWAVRVALENEYKRMTYPGSVPSSYQRAAEKIMAGVQSGAKDYLHCWMRADDWGWMTAIAKTRLFAHNTDAVRFAVRVEAIVCGLSVAEDFA